MILTWIRGKFGKVLVGSLFVLIGFVFTFYGIFSPKATRGLHEGAVAGTVNGEPISLAEFQRALNQRLELFQRFSGGKLSQDQIKAFRLKNSVFQGLVQRKLLLQEAKQAGLLVPVEEIREQIQTMTEFQKDGQFDLKRYQQLLENNSYSPARFERLILEGLLVQLWEKYFAQRVGFSEEEVKRDFLASEEKRELRFVEIPVEAFQADFKKELQLEAKAELTVDQQTELKKRVLAFAEKVKSLLEASPKLSAMKEKELIQLLKAKNLKLETSGSISRKSAYSSRFQGSGSSPIREALLDSFLKKEDKAQLYSLAGRFVVAVVSSRVEASLSSWSKKREELLEAYSRRKANEVQEAWIKAKLDHSKVDPNPAVLSEEE